MRGSPLRMLGAMMLSLVNVVLPNSAINAVRRRGRGRTDRNEPPVRGAPKWRRPAPAVVRHETLRVVIAKNPFANSKGSQAVHRARRERERAQASSADGRAARPSVSSSSAAPLTEATV